MSNDAEFKEKLQAEMLFLDNLIKQHQAKNNSFVPTPKFTMMNQHSSKDSSHAPLFTNRQNTINSLACHPNKFVKNQFFHKNFSSAKNTSNMHYNQPSNYTLVKGKNSLRNSALLNKQNRTIYNKINDNVKNQSLNTAFSNKSAIQLSNADKLNSPRTLCREIDCTTVKLKQKLEIMQMKHAKKCCKDNPFSVQSKEKVKITELSETNLPAKNDNSIRCVYSLERHQEKNISDISTLKSRSFKENVSEPFNPEGSKDKNLDNSLKEINIFCNPKTVRLTDVPCRSSVSACDEKVSNAEKIHDSQSEMLLDKVRNCDQVDKTSFNAIPPLKGVGEKLCNNHLVSAKLIENRRKISPSLISSSRKKIPIKNLSERKNMSITKYKVVDEVDSLLKNIVKDSSKIAVNVASSKSRSYTQSFQNSKYTVINKKLFDSSYRERTDNESTFNTPKSLKKSRTVRTKFKVVNKNSPAVEANVSDLPKTLKKHGKVSTKYKVVNKNSPCIGANAGNLPNSLKKQRKVSTKYKVVNKNSPAIGENANNLPKSLKKQKKVSTKYKVVNKNSPAIGENANNLPKSLKKQRKVSTKYKVINKNSPDIGAKVGILGKSSVKNNYSPKISLKTETSSKKSEKSIYKLLNKSTTKSESAHRRKIHSSGKCKRVINSRFAIVNRKLSPRMKPWESPFKVVPTITKRLYKSPRTIINQNISPLHQVVRMIKTKYRIVNKNKNQLNKSWQKNLYTKPFVFNKRSPSTTKNSHHYTNYIYPQKKTRSGNPVFKRNHLKQNFHSEVSYNGSHQKFKSSRTALKYTKIKKIYSPILFIRGVRFAINPTGKTLKRLSYGDSKSPRKIVVAGKTFVRVAGDVSKRENMFSKTLASRVLNKSIHTARIALSKKEMTKTNKYCKFYNRFGRCNDGIKCSYIHDPSKIAVCTRFLRGTCKNDSCLFSHEISPGKMALCSFFLLGSCNNERCPYRHETLDPGTKLCTDFVQGYCSKGKQCKKAHILVCPHYVQGNCESGSQCAYPHPPQKRRKIEMDSIENIESLLKEKEEKKTINADDDLVEKVSRYFQCDISSNETKVANSKEKTKNDISNMVVSMKCKIPVQPSFIPLS